MKQQSILALFLAAIAWGSPLLTVRAQEEPVKPADLWPNGNPELAPAGGIESPDAAEDVETGEEPEEPEEPADKPLTRERVERTIAEIASLVNRLLNVGQGPRPAVDEIIAYYAPLAQVSYYYTTLAPQELQCLTREQYRNTLMDLAGSFPDPLQEYRYDYRIDRLEVNPDGSEATVIGRTFEAVAIGGRPVWKLTQAWTMSLIPKGDRVLIQEEVSSEELDLRLVPNCPRPDFMSPSILERRKLLEHHNKLPSSH
ncbi:MAG: hypothetical protein AAFY11_09725 [Cyanobacteria bacterium J06641_5]